MYPGRQGGAYTGVYSTHHGREGYIPTMVGRATYPPREAYTYPGRLLTLLYTPRKAINHCYTPREAIIHPREAIIHPREAIIHPGRL